MITPTIMNTSMITTATTMMTDVVDSLPADCGLLLTGEVAIGLGSGVSDMEDPTSL